MNHFISLVVAGVFALADDAAGLQRTAPDPVSLEVAVEHVSAARAAARLYGVDENILLALAEHESRLQPGTVAPESGGRVSCGPLTPEPVAACDSSATILDGYMAGAAHVQGWMRAARAGEAWSEVETLLGVAGGYALIDACANGPVLRRAAPHDDICRFPAAMRARANWIARERARNIRTGA